MTLRKVDWLFIVFAVAVVIGVSLLPTPKDRNPMVPRTPEHDAVKAEKDCVRCHSPGGERPLPARHPKRPDCFRCHARSGSAEGTSSVNGQSLAVVGKHATMTHAIDQSPIINDQHRVVSPLDLMARLRSDEQW